MILLWEGALALCIIVGTYITQGWYHSPFGRYLVSLKGALLALYLPTGIRSVFDPATLRASWAALTYVGLFAILLTYGAYVFVRISHARKAIVPPGTAAPIDRWD